MSKKPKQMKGEVETTGHEWDGIAEYNHPLPRWWLWTLYATIIWAIAYTIAYPAWPLITHATRGVLHQSNRADVAAEIKRYDEANAPVEAKLVATDLTAIAANPDLVNYTQNAGGAVFRTWCAQCHGSGAAGAKGFPNLNDDDWLWGGTIDEIFTTINHGARFASDDDTRVSEMPAFGRDELLDRDQIDEVANYVLSLSGLDHDAALAEKGATVFADNCASCHGDEGKGDITLGAPNLADAIWLYGDTKDAIVAQVTSPRHGVMPAWGPRLGETKVKELAVYIHSLGGGE